MKSTVKIQESNFSTLALLNSLPGRPVTQPVYMSYFAEPHPLTLWPSLPYVPAPGWPDALSVSSSFNGNYMVHEIVRNWQSWLIGRNHGFNALTGLAHISNCPGLPG